MGVEITAQAVGPMRTALRTGVWYAPGFSNRATKAMTVNRLYCVPFWVPRPTAIQNIGLAVSGAGGAGSVIRLGVYADVADQYGGAPGALLGEAASTIDGTSATSQFTALSLTLPAGLVWLAAVAQVGTSPTVRSVTGGMQIVGQTSDIGDSDSTGVFQNSVSGAMPATYTYSSLLLDSVPRITVQVA